MRDFRSCSGYPGWDNYVWMSWIPCWVFLDFMHFDVLNMECWNSRIRGECISQSIPRRLAKLIRDSIVLRAWVKELRTGKRKEARLFIAQKGPFLHRLKAHKTFITRSQYLAWFHIISTRLMHERPWAMILNGMKISWIAYCQNSRSRTSVVSADSTL